MKDPGPLRQTSCPNCGAELDALENYRLLRRFAKKMPRPDRPLKIGAKGRILGQSWRLISVLGQTENWRGRSWHRVERLIYSEPHGYAI